MKVKNSLFIRSIYVVIVIFLAYFIIYPILSVFFYGLSNSYENMLTAKNILKNMTLLKNSILVASIVTIISTIIGFVMAFTLNRIKFKGRRLMKILAFLPFVSPPFVGSVSFIMLFGRRGLITYKLLGLSVSPYGLSGIVFIQVLSFSALAYLLISSAIKKYDPTFEEAARNLGSSEIDIIKRVMLPIMLPELSSTILLVFLASMSDFSTPIIIGGDYHTLASDLYVQIVGVYDMKSAAVSGLILLVPCLVIFAYQKYYLEKKTYFSDNIMSLDITHKGISRPAKAVFLSITCIYLMIVILKYAFIVVGAFTVQWGYDYTFTLKYIKEISLSYSQIKPFINSIKLASITAFFSSLIGVLIAYLIKFKNVYKAKFIDLIATLPAAVPGILFGIGYLVGFRIPILGIGRYIFKDHEPLLLLGTGIIIYIIVTARYLNIGLRAGYATLEHIDPDIEKASFNLGADEFTTLLKIILPIMKDAFYASFLKNFSSGMVTLGAIIFLLLPSNKVAVQQIFSTLSSSSIAVAATMSLSLSILTLVLLGMYYLLFYFTDVVIILIKRGFLKWKFN